MNKKQQELVEVLEIIYEAAAAIMDEAAAVIAEINSEREVGEENE